MEFTLIPIDNLVAVDGAVIRFGYNDLIDNNIHAVVWYGQDGQIEFRDGAVNEIITDYTAYQPILDIYADKLSKIDDIASAIEYEYGKVSVVYNNGSSDILDYADIPADIVIDELPDSLKITAVKAKLKLERQEVSAQAIPYTATDGEDYVLDCNMRNRMNMHQAAFNNTNAGRSDSTTIRWKMGNNAFKDVKVSMLKEFGLAIAQHIETQFAVEEARLIALEALGDNPTREELDAL